MDGFYSKVLATWFGKVEGKKIKIKSSNHSPCKGQAQVKILQQPGLPLKFEPNLVPAGRNVVPPPVPPTSSISPSHQMGLETHQGVSPARGRRKEGGVAGLDTIAPLVLLQRCGCRKPPNSVLNIVTSVFSLAFSIFAAYFLNGDLDIVFRTTPNVKG